MSCYMVDRNHVIFLVNAATQAGRADPVSYRHNGHRYEPKWEDAAALANMLWRENKRSVFYRYPDCEEGGEIPGEVGENYIVCENEAHKEWASITAVQVIKAAHSYSYQACEHPEWEDSHARAFIDALIEHYIYKIPGYDDAKWGAPEALGNVQALF